MTKQDLTWYEPQTPDEIINELITKHHKDSFYVLTSGGRDSMCVLDFITKNYPENFKGGVFTNTGVGSQETRKFVIDYFHKNNLPLYMTWAQPNERFLLIALRNGFAFAGNHGMWLGYLKQHSWYYFLKDRIKLGEKACFISGVRKKESWARDKKKRYTKKPIDIGAKQTYCKPFLWKNGSQIIEYQIINDVKTTKVYEWAGKSGECWCGSHVNAWDLKLLEKYDKLQFENIRFVENMMQTVLQRLMKANNVTLDQIANWHRIYESENDELVKTLTKRQKQMVCLAYYNKWGNQSTNDIVAQRTLFDFNQTSGISINVDYCGESC